MVAAELDFESPYVCLGCDATVVADANACPVCAESRPRGGWPLDARLGKLVLERYRLVRRLGRGASSQVFLARDERLPEPAAAHVVVKVLSGLASENERKRFLTEVRAIRSVGHPGIVKVYDAGFSEGTPCIVMEHLRGQTLRARMQEDLPDEEGVRVALAIAEVMSEAHERGILHRDLKPENVFLSGGNVKLLDFGAAAFVDATGTRSIVGTPRYMAPEQMQAVEERAAPLDARVDIYALGALLFEMLSKQLPTQGATVQELLAAKLANRRTPLQRLRGDLSPSLLNLVESMLHVDPKQRPPSMTVVAQRLRGLGDSPSLPTPTPVLRRQGASRRVVVVAAVAAFAALALALSWSRWTGPVKAAGDQGVAATSPVTSRSITDEADPKVQHGAGGMTSRSTTTTSASTASTVAATAPRRELPAALVAPSNARGSNAASAAGPGSAGPGSAGPVSSVPGSAGPGSAGHSAPSVASAPGSVGRSGALRREDF